MVRGCKLNANWGEIKVMYSVLREHSVNYSLGCALWVVTTFLRCPFLNTSSSMSIGFKSKKESKPIFA